MNNNPIGVFDSGVGGLSVWREIRRALPGESLVYFGDGLNCPYGMLTNERVAELTVEAVGWLVKKRGAKLVVLACNTATAAAVDEVRARFAVPIVGMLPAIKPAAASTRTGVIGVLATERSLASGALGRYIDEFARGVEVVVAAGEGFVELVEQGREESYEALESVRRVVEPMLARGVDRLVLGCTHYPFLHWALEKTIGSRDVGIVDPAPAVARRVVQLLGEHDIAADEAHVVDCLFHTLGGADYLARMEERARKAVNDEK